MALFWIFLVLSHVIIVSASKASGDFMVLYSPKSCKFSGSRQIVETVIQEIFFAFIGLSVKKRDTEWNGLSIVDPFDTPEAIVEVYVDGVSILGSGFGKKAKVYPLTAIENEPSTFKTVKHRIMESLPYGDNKFVNIDLSDTKQLNSSVLGKISLPKKMNVSLHLQYSDEWENRFFSELGTLKSLIKNILALKPDNNIDYYFFRFRSLRALSDIHGPSSFKVIEAEKLLSEALQDFSAAFVEAYDGSVVVTVEATHARDWRRSVHKRHRRNVEEEQDYYTDDETTTTKRTKRKRTTRGPPEPGGIREALNKATDLLVMINIMTFFIIGFAFANLAIVYTMMDMDPGRDSLIYLLTSYGMMKDY